MLGHPSEHPIRTVIARTAHLAAELPAAILARMLGVHIQVAVQWQKASAGDWAAYAADVSRRAGGNDRAACLDDRHPDPRP